MERYGIQWKQLGTHNKHLSVLDFEKQERQKEVQRLVRTIVDSKVELSAVISQKTKIELAVTQIERESEAVRQEITELAETNAIQLPEIPAGQSPKYQHKRC